MQTVPLAVIAALDEEIKPLVSRMTVDERVHVGTALFTRGTCDRRPLLAGRSGMGRKAMERAMRTCLGSWRPAFCLHVGYCGGADPALAVGDMAIASAVKDADTGQLFAADPALIERTLRLLADHKLRGRAGTIVTVENVVPSPHDKAFVGARHDAIAIDMESSVLAAACAASGIPYLVARAVLDPLDQELPDLSGTIDEAGRLDGVGIACHLLRHPADLFKLPSIEYAARQARRSIAAFIEAWMKEAAQ